MNDCIQNPLISEEEILYLELGEFAADFFMPQFQTFKNFAIKWTGLSLAKRRSEKEECQLLLSS